jgi:hypothetical protein
LELGYLLVGFIGFQLVEGSFAILDGRHQFVFRREGWIGDVLVEELDGVAETRAAGGFNVA